MKRLTKKAIREIIQNMKNNTCFHFYSNMYTRKHTTHRIAKKQNKIYIYSSGQGWCDQIAEDFSIETIIKMLYNSNVQDCEYCGEIG